MNGKCCLCQKEADLCLSHIIPKFVIIWLKETSPGAIRDSRVPNRRVQDGIKEYMLCEECEKLFSSWEHSFAENIFFPLHNNNNKIFTLPYKEWCLKFTVSVSWRVLMRAKLLGISLKHNIQTQKINVALNRWKEFLIGNRNHPDEFEQHIIPLDIIDTHTAEGLSPFINRYLLRSVDVDIPSSDNRAFVYIKMGKVMLIGFIYEPHPDWWKNSKIHVHKGFICSKRYIAPDGLYEYINYRASKAAATLRSLSATQKNKITEMQKQNLDKLKDSEVLRAMNQDVELFGRAAFKITDEPE
jgi:hypothetical protein